MGIDHRGVGGIGIRVTEEHIRLAIAAELFTEDEWENDPGTCLDTFGLDYEEAGSAYSGDLRYYFLVSGETYREIGYGSIVFLATLNKLGLHLTLDDLVVVSDYLVY